MQEFYTKDNIPPSLYRRFQKNGHWLVDNDLIFTNKVQALIYCTEQGTDNVKYHLDSDIFGALDWTKEPSESLLDLYKLRAQQIRDSYDYVVVAFSGGGDSTNIIRSFVDNDIKIDEVVSLMLLGKGFDKAGWGMNGEILANLDFIKTHVTDNGIKYTQLNSSNLYEDNLHSEDWIFKFGSRKPGPLNKFSALYNDVFKRIRDKGKKACIVLGYEKPNLRVDNGSNILCYFLDNQLDHANNHRLYDPAYDGLQYERFYVTGDMPQLTIKQSHIIANYFADKPASHETLKFGYSKSWGDYKNIVTNLLYGHCFSYDSFFSFGKLDNQNLKMFRDRWFWNLEGNEFGKQAVESGIDYMSKHIDKKYFNNGNIYNDLVGCISNFYKVGKRWKQD